MKNKVYYNNEAIVVDKGNNTFVVRLKDNKKQTTKEIVDWAYGNPFTQYTPKLTEQLLAYKLKSII